MNFTDFNEQFSRKYNKKLNQICDPLFNIFGLNSFFYQVITKDGRFISINNNPDLMDFYFVDQEMHFHNPFIVKFNHINSGLYIYDLIHDNTFLKTCDTLKEQFNVEYFGLLTRKNSDMCYEFGFGRDPNKRNNNLLINNLPLIKSFIKHFETEIEPIAKKMRDNPILLSKNLFTKDVSIELQEIELDLATKTQFLKKIGYPKEITDIHFTNSEITCLKLLVKGYPASAIAKELSLSIRTIEHKIAELKGKCGCKNKCELLKLLQRIKEAGLHPEIFL